MNLSEPVDELRTEIVAAYELTPAEKAVLDKGLEALETANRAQAELDAAPSLFTPNRFDDLIPHPAIRVAKDARQQFLAAMKQLGLADPYGGAGGHGRGAQRARK